MLLSAPPPANAPPPAIAAVVAPPPANAVVVEQLPETQFDSSSDSDLGYSPLPLGQEATSNVLAAMDVDEDVNYSSDNGADAQKDEDEGDSGKTYVGDETDLQER